MIDDPGPHEGWGGLKIGPVFSANRQTGFPYFIARAVSAGGSGGRNHVDYDYVTLLLN